MALLSQSKTSLWEVALSKMPKEDRETLKAGLGLHFKFDDLKSTIDKIRGNPTLERRRIKLPLGEIDVRERFDKLVSWVQKFIAIGDTIVTYDPGHAALPWAALRFILQMMVNDSTRAAAFIKGLEQVAFYIYDCTVRERLYLVRETSEDRKQLEAHIVALYVAILQFMLMAKLFFVASTAKRVVSSVYKSADGVLQLLDVAAQHAWQITVVSSRIDSENQLTTQSSVHNLSESHQLSMAWLQQRLDEDKNTMMDVIRSNHSMIIDNFDWQNARLDRLDDAIGHLVGHSKSRQAPTRSLFYRSVSRLLILQRAVAAFEGGYKVYDRSKILEWLSVIPYHQHHKQAYSEVQQGTGMWFLQDIVYENWKNLPESSLLWLHGPPGCGKSKLMSLAIQEALKIREISATTHVLFFYCSGTPAEPERANPEAILRCLVKQGLASGLRLEPSRVPRYVVQSYKMAELDGFASEGLDLDECCTIISKYAIDHATTYIFIDAIDECPDESRFRLMKTLQGILDRVSSSFVKFLVASRDDLSLGTFFNKAKTWDIQVDGNRNQRDVDHYVQAQLRQLILQKRISLLSRPISSGLEEIIIDRLSKGAQGMFRWVSVMLEYLCTLKTKRDIENRLGRLPPSLINGYGELFRQRTEQLGVDHRRRLDLAFSLLLLPRRPQAHIFRWLLFLEDEDEDSDHIERHAVIDADMGLRNILENQAVLIEGYDAVTQLCFNFVVFDKDAGVYRFAHTSVQEFLSEHTQGYYSEHFNHGRVAEHCLPILLRMRDRFRDNTRLSSDDKRGSRMKLENQGQVLQARANRDSTQAHYYFQLPPISERTVREHAIFWMRENWAYFLLNSKPYRHLSPLKDLEIELQELATKQTFESLRATVFFQACRFGLKNIVEAWVKAHPQLVLIRELPPIGLTKTDLFMGTALQLACHSGQMETVEFLINNGAQVDHCIESPTKTNALCTAIRECHVPVVKLLLERGASPNTDPDADVNYPMHYVISNWTTNIIPVLQLLVEHGANIDAEDDSGTTALVRALLGDNIEAMAFLLDKGAKASYTVPRRGINSTLHLAVFLRKNTLDRSLAMVRTLLEHGADVNFRGLYGETPLHRALRKARLGNFDISKIVLLLLDNGASVNVRDVYGLTPLNLIMRRLKGHPENKSKPVFAPISESNAGNETSPVNALSAETVHDLEVERIARMLCASGADASIPATNGWTALHQAVSKGRPNIVDLTIRSNAQVNATSARGDTALHIAAWHGYVDIAKSLITSGADPNIVCQWGSSPLANAAQNGHTEVAKLLLPITADIENQDGDGDTALSNAASKGHEVVVRLLLDAGAEIVPHAPGPHCSFLSRRENLEGYGRDAILRAWQQGQPDVARMILEHAAAGEPENEYAKVSKLWEAGHTALVKSWMNERIANAPENRPEMVALRERVKARYNELIEEIQKV